MSGWDEKAVPDQSGRVAVVTGANSGLGYVVARELARKGARVVLACRSEVRGARRPIGSWAKCRVRSRSSPGSTSETWVPYGSSRTGSVTSGSICSSTTPG